MPGSDHALHTFMAQVTAEMGSEYARIYARAAEDPGTAGDEGEENWATLLREWLPPAYHVATKGRLIAADGTYSPQIDVLVLKPFYPPKLREKKVWLANGVAAAFECKTTLRSQHISASATRCRDFKALFAERTGTPERELRSSLIYGILAHSHGWKNPGSNPTENVGNSLWQTLESATRPSDTIDMVCVSDLGCWSQMAIPYYEASWRDSDRAAFAAAIFGGNWGPVTSMMEASYLSENQQKGFQPIGSFVSYLTQRLAWNDASIRDLADYYRKSHLWGSGSGTMRLWPQSIFSNGVRQNLNSGPLSNSGDWGEWNASII